MTRKQNTPQHVLPWVQGWFKNIGNFLSYIGHTRAYFVKMKLFSTLLYLHVSNFDQDKILLVISGCLLKEDLNWKNYIKSMSFSFSKFLIRFKSPKCRDLKASIKIDLFEDLFEESDRPID